MRDLAALLDAVRRPVFGGRMNQSQVDGVLRLLEGAKRNGVTDVRHVAYGLATGAWETGRKMQPLEEYGKGAGRAYGKPDKTTGERYFGRGDVQLTWIDNYRQFAELLGVDLVHNPELALDPDVSADVLWIGCRDGLFRKGHSLKRYFPPGNRTGDPIMARLIVNGIPKGKKLPDRAEEIADYHAAFLRGLEAAGWPDVEIDGEDRGEPLRRPDGAPERPVPGNAPTGAGRGRNNVQIPHGERSGSILAVQTRLKALNYHDVGELDGKWGGRTRGAIAAFLNDRERADISVDDITPELVAELDAAEAVGFKRPIAKARSDAQAPEVAPKLETVNQSWWSQFTAWLIGLPAAFLALAKTYLGDGDGDGMPDIVKTAFDAFSAVPSQYYAYAVTAAAIAVAVFASRAKRAAVKAYQEGRLSS